MEEGIKLQIEVDAKNGIRVVDAFGDTLHKSTKKGVKGVKGLSGAFESLKNRLIPTNGLIAKFGLGISAWKLADMAGGFLDTASSMETYETTLGTVLKSTQRAADMMKWIGDFAASTPFEIPGLVESAVRLEAYGLNAKKYMRTLGDTAAAMGKPMMQAVEMIADASQGEFERMKEFGLRASDVAKEAGFKSVQEMTSTRKNLIKGTDTLMAMLEKRYAGGMKKLSGTWAGMVSNMKDMWTQFRMAVMDKKVFNYLKAAISIVHEKLSELKEAGRLDVWAAEVAKGVVTSFGWIIKGGALVADVFRGWEMIWKMLEIAWGTTKSLILEGIIELAKGCKFFLGLIGADDGLEGMILELEHIQAGWNVEIANSKVRLSDLAAQTPALAQVKGLLDEINQKAEGMAQNTAQKAEGMAQNTAQAVQAGQGGGATEESGTEKPAFEDDLGKLVEKEQAKFDIAVNGQTALEKALISSEGRLSKMRWTRFKEEQKINKLKKKSAQSTANYIIQTGKLLMQTSAGQNEVIFGIVKAASIAQAVMSTYTGAANALRDVPYPWNFVAAASVIAYGMAQVHAIMAQSMDSATGAGAGGGGGAGVPITSPTAAPVVDSYSSSTPTFEEEEEKQKGVVNIYLGDIHADEYYIERLAEKLSELVEDYDVRLVASDSKVAEALA